MPLPPDQEKTIRRLLSHIDALGLFPQAAMRIHEVASHPNSSHADMEKAISLEPALSVQILRIANSPFYGLRRNVGSLRQAIFVLGFRAIQGLALSLAVLHMGGTEDPPRRRAWRHALGTGVVARRLAGIAGGVEVGEAFVAGLLHDLGRTVLLEVAGPEAVLRVEAESEDARARLRGEVERFGCDHATLGAAALEAWQLPDALCAAVRHHHDSDGIAAVGDPASRRVAEIVWAADLVEQGADARLPVPEIALRLRAAGLDAPGRFEEAAIADTVRAIEEEMEQLAGISTHVRAPGPAVARPLRRRAWG